MHEASQQLIDILLSNGFKEHTSFSHPEHWNLLQEKGFYDRDSVKRDLRYGKLKVFFKYQSIEISYNESAYPKIRNELSESEVKSLILFTKLSPLNRAFLKRHHIYPTEIVDYIEKYDEEDLVALPSPSRKVIAHFKTLIPTTY